MAEAQKSIKMLQEEIRRLRAAPETPGNNEAPTPGDDLPLYSSRGNDPERTGTTTPSRNRTTTPSRNRNELLPGPFTATSQQQQQQQPQASTEQGFVRNHQQGAARALSSG